MIWRNAVRRLLRTAIILGVLVARPASSEQGWKLEMPEPSPRGAGMWFYDAARSRAVLLFGHTLVEDEGAVMRRDAWELTLDGPPRWQEVEE